DYMVRCDQRGILERCFTAQFAMAPKKPLMPGIVFCSPEAAGPSEVGFSPEPSGAEPPWAAAAPQPTRTTVSATRSLTERMEWCAAVHAATCRRCAGVRG